MKFNWKRSLTIFGICAILFVTLTSEESCESPPSSDAKGQLIKEQVVDRLVDRIPTPEITQAIEREMIARRAKLFDQQNKLGYVYLIAQSGDVIGYYTIFGKMASLNSYLVPQQKLSGAYVYRNSDGTYSRTTTTAQVMDDADIDGTYGSNIEGVFFFTNNGTYVELPTTAGVTPIYSDKPLPIRAVKFN